VVSAVAGIAGVLALTAATGYFVAQEFAFTIADRTVLEAEAAQGDTAARRALAVMGRLSFMLSGAQLGITVTALVTGLIASPAVADLAGPALAATGLPDGAARAAAAAAGFVIATGVQMVGGELAPKNLALARAGRLAKRLAPSTLAYLAVAGPLIRVFDSAAARLLRVIGVEPAEELASGVTAADLADIIGSSQRAGRLPGDLSGLLVRALTFGDRTAAEVMVPRPDVATIAGSATAGELAALVAATGHTSFPVWDSAPDDVTGIAGVRELAACDDADVPVARIMRPLLLVPGTLPTEAVVARMREAREEFACVADEYGGLAGIVTFEDLAEELTGPIADENDPEPAGTARRQDGAWELDAATRIDEAREATGLALPEAPGYDTVSGLVLARLGRLPRPGDRVEVDLGPEAGPAGRAEIEVTSVRRHVARRVRVRPVRATARPARRRRQ
jgi:CBS domain containing-hemolysin-like protein